MGSEEPAVSMDRTGKIVMSKHNEIKLLNVKYASGAEEDGEKLPLPPKDLGSCEMYPKELIHNSNGRFVVACGDGEYVIYTSLKWRNKAFGRGLEFVWAKGTGDYAVLESKSKIKMYKNFKEVHVFRPNFSAGGIYTGELLGIRSPKFICFYNWDSV
jgi:coatomer subunit beta'